MTHPSVCRRSLLCEKKLNRKRVRLREMTAELTEEEKKEFTETQNPFVVPGYVGKPKGSRMHVFVRGRWSDGLTHKQCCAILNGMPDFKLETSRLEKWWICKGHGSVKTIKSTPECVEAEYDWGKGKYEFRNHINTKSTSVPVYRASVLTALGRHSYVSRTGTYTRAHTLFYQFITHSYCAHACVYCRSFATSSSSPQEALAIHPQGERLPPCLFFV